MRNIHTSKSIPAKNQPTNGHMSRSIEDAPSKMGICMNKVALDAYHEGPSGGFCFFFTDLQSIREVLSWRLGRKNWIPAARNIKCHVADCVRADSERMTSTPRRMQNRTMTASAFEQNGRGGKNLTILQVTWWTLVLLPVVPTERRPVQIILVIVIWANNPHHLSNKKAFFLKKKVESLGIAFSINLLHRHLVRRWLAWSPHPFSNGFSICSICANLAPTSGVGLASFSFSSFVIVGQQLPFDHPTTPFAMVAIASASFYEWMKST
jgi:hypothetical protein